MRRLSEVAASARLDGETARCGESVFKAGETWGTCQGGVVAAVESALGTSEGRGRPWLVGSGCQRVKQRRRRAAGPACSCA